MERLFAYILFILIGTGSVYLLVAFVLMPIIKMFRESRRLK